MKKARYFALFLVVVSLCAFSSSAVVGEDAANQPTGDVSSGRKIAPGDELTIYVAGEPELTGAFKVDRDGSIVMPLVKQFKIAGLDTVEAKKSLSKALSEYIVEPQVSVNVKSAALTSVLVMGEVLKPGAVGVLASGRLRDALLISGGPVPGRGQNVVSFLRAGKSKVINIDKLLSGTDEDDNVVLQDGDVLYVPSKSLGTVTLLGAIKAVGKTPVIDGDTCMDVLSRVGGPLGGADLAKATLKHSNGNTDPLDIEQLIRSGSESQNAIMKDGDTLTIPYKQSREAAFNLMGAVTRPSRYEITESVKLSDAIAMAGGFSPEADLGRVLVSRKGQAQPVVVNLNQSLGGKSIGKDIGDMELNDGDTVTVPFRHDKWGFIKSLTPYVLSPLIYSVIR